jgi:hypothetical protein
MTTKPTRSERRNARYALAGKINRLALAGRTTLEICAELGINRQRLYLCCMECGVPTPAGTAAYLKRKIDPLLK